MRFTLLLAIPAVLLLSGCAKMMNENECMVADWRTLGYQDGSAGRSESYLEKRGEACAEYGVAPNMDQYLLGRTQGLITFCQPNRAFAMGNRGDRYQYVCPSDLESNFLVAYQDGRGLLDRRALLSDFEHEHASTLTELDRLEQQIATDTISLTKDALSTEERVALALSIKEMAEERGRLQTRLPQIEIDIANSRVDLDMYTASIAGKYPGSI